MIRGQRGNFSPLSTWRASMMTPKQIVLESCCAKSASKEIGGEDMRSSSPPSFSSLLYHHASRPLFASLQPGNLPAEEPDLGDVSEQAKLEEGNFPIALLRLELGWHWIPAASRAGLFNALEDAIGPAVESVGGHEDPTQTLVPPLGVEFIDPSADLLLGIEVVAELDPVDQLLLDGLVDGLDLPEGLRVLGGREQVIDAVGLEHPV